MGKRIWAVVLAAVLLSGCGEKQSTPGLGVVFKITVTCHDGGAATQQVYTTQQKTRMILNAIRSLGQQFNPSVDPEALEDRTIDIVISFTDGSSRSYQTKGDRYIRTDQGRWRQTEPKPLERLNQLLLTLPGDRMTPSDGFYQRGFVFCFLVKSKEIRQEKLDCGGGKQSNICNQKPSVRPLEAGQHQKYHLCDQNRHG